LRGGSEISYAVIYVKNEDIERQLAYTGPLIRLRHNQSPELLLLLCEKAVTASDWQTSELHDERDLANRKTVERLDDDSRSVEPFEQRSMR